MRGRGTGLHSAVSMSHVRTRQLQSFPPPFLLVLLVHHHQPQTVPASSLARVDDCVGSHHQARSTRVQLTIEGGTGLGRGLRGGPGQE